MRHGLAELEPNGRTSRVPGQSGQILRGAEACLQSAEVTDVVATVFALGREYDLSLLPGASPPLSISMEPLK